MANGKSHTENERFLRKHYNGKMHYRPSIIEAFKAIYPDVPAESESYRLDPAECTEDLLDNGFQMLSSLEDLIARDEAEEYFGDPVCEDLLEVDLSLYGLKFQEFMEENYPPLAIAMKSWNFLMLTESILQCDVLAVDWVEKWLEDQCYVDKPDSRWLKLPHPEEDGEEIFEAAFDKLSLTVFYEMRERIDNECFMVADAYETFCAIRMSEMHYLETAMIYQQIEDEGVDVEGDEVAMIAEMLS